MKMCCTNCFHNTHIIEIIEKNNQIGDCSFCGAQSVFVINIDPEFSFEITYPLRGIKVAYRNSGYKIDELLTRHIDLLNPQTTSEAKKDLVRVIFENVIDEDDINFTFTLNPPREKLGRSLLEAWEKFKEQIRHENRFGFGIDPRLKEALTEILTINKKLLPKGEEYFRARLGNPPGTRFYAYEKEEIMAAPKDMVSEGRINPRGIPYLYIASRSQTAIAEVRPYKGKNVSVAVVRLLEDLTISSFTNPIFHGKPLDSQVELYHLTEQINFELSKPVDEETKYLDYIPYQYISEFAKHLGFEGIQYKSALEDGINVCVFYPDKVEWVESDLYEVTAIKVEAASLSNPLDHVLNLDV